CGGRRNRRAPPFPPRAFWRRLGPWLTAAGDADPPHVAAGKAGRGKAARTIGGKRGGASGAASRFSPHRPGGRTQRIETRPLFIAQRIVEFRERGLQGLHGGERGVAPLLHRLDPEPWG